MYTTTHQTTQHQLIMVPLCISYPHIQSSAYTGYTLPDQCTTYITRVRLQWESEWFITSLIHNALIFYRRHWLMMVGCRSCIWYSFLRWVFRWPGLVLYCGQRWGLKWMKKTRHIGNGSIVNLWAYSGQDSSHMLIIILSFT